MFIVPLTQMDGTENLKSIMSVGNTDKKDLKDEVQSFGDVLKDKIQNVKDLESASLESAYAVSTGASNDIEGAMLDSAKASTAIEMTVQLTTRAVNAYKEIMSMQV